MSDNGNDDNDCKTIFSADVSKYIESGTHYSGKLMANYQEIVSLISDQEDFEIFTGLSLESNPHIELSLLCLHEFCHHTDNCFSWACQAFSNGQRAFQVYLENQHLRVTVNCSLLTLALESGKALELHFTNVCLFLLEHWQSVKQYRVDKLQVQQQQQDNNLSQYQERVVQWLLEEQKEIAHDIGDKFVSLGKYTVDVENSKFTLFPNLFKGDSGKTEKHNDKRVVCTPFGFGKCEIVLEYVKHSAAAAAAAATPLSAQLAESYVSGNTLVITNDPLYWESQGRAQVLSIKDFHDLSTRSYGEFHRAKIVVFNCAVLFNRRLQTKYQDFNVISNTQFVEAMQRFSTQSVYLCDTPHPFHFYWDKCFFDCSLTTQHVRSLHIKARQYIVLHDTCDQELTIPQYTISRQELETFSRVLHVDLDKTISEAFVKECFCYCFDEQVKVDYRTESITLNAFECAMYLQTTKRNREETLLFGESQQSNPGGQVQVKRIEECHTHFTNVSKELGAIALEQVQESVNYQIFLNEILADALLKNCEITMSSLDLELDYVDKELEDLQKQYDDSRVVLGKLTETIEKIQSKESGARMCVVCAEEEVQPNHLVLPICGHVICVFCAKRCKLCCPQCRKRWKYREIVVLREQGSSCPMVSSVLQKLQQSVQEEQYSTPIVVPCSSNIIALKLSEFFNHNNVPTFIVSPVQQINKCLLEQAKIILYLQSCLFKNHNSETACINLGTLSSTLVFLEKRGISEQNKRKLISLLGHARRKQDTITCISFQCF